MQFNKATLGNNNDVRGFRNNNPLNLRVSKSNWLGKIKQGKRDSSFEEFETLEYGIRAGIKNMNTWLSRGYNTVEKYIAKHAPANENDTAAYVRNVASWARVNPDSVITAKNKAQIVASIIRMENGRTLQIAEIQNVINKYAL